MLTLHQTRLLAHIAHWRLGWWDTYEPDAVPKGAGPMFISARQAGALFRDGDVCCSTGLASHGRASVFFWALRDRFAATGSPRGLTWITVGAQGGRGKIPGTLEEMAAPGLVTRAIMGHWETVKAWLPLVDSGRLEAHTLPQGEMALLIEKLGDGPPEHLTDVGVGTFLDPRVGPGSPIAPGATENFVEAVGDRLRYRLPEVDVAVICAPFADAAGNIYFHGASCVTEMHDLARGVHRSGGRVLVTVADIIDPTGEEVGIPADWVDHIVVNEYSEQSASIRQRHYWPMFTPGAHVDEHRAVADLRYINETLKVTPHRSRVDMALARLAARVVLRELTPGALMNIGVGLPEEVAKLFFVDGLSADITQTTETGVVGGVPCSGMFFGAAINPQRHERSSWVFHRYEEGYDLACLGLLEVDSEGNVNVSRRGDKAVDYVGPGGFTNVAHPARTIVFVGTWTAHAKMHLSQGRLVIDEVGEPKFIDRVHEVTFNGREALRRGQRVLYVTTVGVFRLTDEGLRLESVMPGVDIDRDIRGVSGARIVVPDEVPVVPPEIVTGEGYHLAWA